MNYFKLSILALLIAAMGQTVSAQSWCAPGAQWTQFYNTVDWGTGYSTEGYVISRYMGDTLIAGYMAQHIHRDRYYRELGTDEYTLGTYPPKYTRYEDGVLFHWNGLDMLDTLLWFGASPGDHWTLPGGGNDIQFMVSDTATGIIGGTPLRRLVVSIVQLSGPYTLATDTLYERIGLVHGDSFDPVIIAVDGISSGFLCYRDDAISYTAHGVTDCGFTVNVEEATMAEGLRLWPNPGSDVLHIETGRNERTEVRVLDGMGRAVMVASSPNGYFVLGGSSLVPGIYFIEVNSAAGRRTMKWVKQ